MEGGRRGRCFCGRAAGDGWTAELGGCWYCHRGWFIVAHRGGGKCMVSALLLLLQLLSHLEKSQDREQAQR